MDEILSRIANGTTTVDDCLEVELMATALLTLLLFVHEVSLFCDDEDFATRAGWILNDIYRRED